MLSVILVAGTVYAITTFTTITSLNVSEPLTVSPQTQTLTVFAGDTQTYSVSISNAASFSILVKFSAQITSGDSGFIAVTWTFDHTTLVPSPFNLLGGQSVTIHVHVAVDPAATPGSRVITNTVMKA